jgi:hypothetical protein
VETEAVTIETPGLRVAVCCRGDALAAAKAAFEAAKSITSHVHAPRECEDVKSDAFGSSTPKTSKCARIREIATEILSDGHIHERREISRAVREAGLNTTCLVAALSGRFEEGRAPDGRPTYRDRSVANGGGGEYEPPVYRIEELIHTNGGSGDG